MEPSSTVWRPGSELLGVSCDDETLALAEAVRGALSGHWAVGELDRAAAEGLHVTDEAWAWIEDIGVTGAVAPAHLGGAGAELSVLSMAIEEVGYFGLPVPVVECAVVRPLLLRSGLLPDESSGPRALTVALSMQGPTYSSPSSTLNLRADGCIEWHSVVDSSPTPCIDPLFPRAALSRTPNAETREHRGAALPAVLCAGLLWGYASYLNGVSMYLITRTLAHTKQRMQFDRPLFGFQAVRHSIAKAFVDLVLARAGAHEVARSHGIAGERFVTTAFHAALLAQEAARKANHLGLQFHGALGFSWETGIHWWLKRGKAVEGWLDRVMAEANVWAPLTEED